MWNDTAIRSLKETLPFIEFSFQIYPGEAWSLIQNSTCWQSDNHCHKQNIWNKNKYSQAIGCINMVEAEDTKKAV